MRRLLAGALAGLFAAAAAMAVGCDNKKTTQTPPMMELPKGGPQPVGGLKGKGGGGGGGGEGGKNVSSQ